MAVSAKTWAAASVPVAMTASNVLAYALVLLAAHRLGAGAFGEVSSLLGLLLISTIPMTALQTVAARRAATGVGEAGLARATAVIAFGSGALLCALSPALAAFLHLDGEGGILLIAATVPANAALGATIGMAQGRRQFRLLATRTFAALGLRPLGGMAGLLIGHSADATIVGILGGVTLAATLILLSLRTAGPARVGGRADTVGLVGETLHAAHAYGLFVFVTSLGVLLAKHLLSPTGAGMFAVGAALTRAVVWLPQFVPTLLFASLAEADRHVQALRRAGLAILGLGLLAIAGSALLGRYIVSALGGSRYHALDHDMWLFAALGVLLCLLQLAITAGLAQRRRRHVVVMWALIVADLVAALLLGDHATPVRLVVTLVGVTAVVAVVALAPVSEDGRQEQKRDDGEPQHVLRVQQVGRREDEHQRRGGDEGAVGQGA
jgi:uncharacterized membrane protein YuzA (DUF378 family)